MQLRQSFSKAHRKTSNLYSKRSQRFSNTPSLTEVRDGRRQTNSGRKDRRSASDRGLRLPCILLSGPKKVGCTERSTKCDKSSRLQPVERQRGRDRHRLRNREENLARVGGSGIRKDSRWPEDQNQSHSYRLSGRRPGNSR